MQPKFIGDAVGLNICMSFSSPEDEVEVDRLAHEARHV